MMIVRHLHSVIIIPANKQQNKAYKINIRSNLIIFNFILIN